MIVGKLPEDLGTVDIDNKESMLYLYMPVSIKGVGSLRLPPQLDKFKDILFDVHKDIGEQAWLGSYIYLTVKAMYVSGEGTGQRSGWHSDGFMTEDINYVWCDREPTEFYGGYTFKVPLHHHNSMVVMELMGRMFEPIEYPVKTLLKLTPEVVHRPREVMESGFRTFVKVSVSKHVYALEGNTINYHPDIYEHTKHWTYLPRGVDRNCPAQGELK